MESLAATLSAPSDEWAEVERWSLRAQALAELRALSDQGPDEPSSRAVRVP